jgi:hypothetical protein
MLFFRVLSVCSESDVWRKSPLGESSLPETDLQKLTLPSSVEMSAPFCFSHCSSVEWLQCKTESKSKRIAEFSFSVRPQGSQTPEFSSFDQRQCIQPKISQIGFVLSQFNGLQGWR